MPHDNHLSLRKWKMSNHSIRKCATKPCQVIVSSHDNSLWRHTLLERRSLRLARLTHFGLPVDVEHTPTMFAHCNNRSPVPIIRLLRTNFCPVVAWGFDYAHMQGFYAILL